MRSYQTLIVDQNPPVLSVSLNRPDKANAVNSVMLNELNDLFIQLRRDESTRFVVITGQGSLFTSGIDLQEKFLELQNYVSPYVKARLDQLDCQEFMKRFESLEQVSIAAINGPAYGAGLAFALACDFRIMSERAFICVPETNLGIFFSWGCTPRLVNVVGAAVAKELIMTGRKIAATEALRIGLVNKVTPDERLFATVYELIDEIKDKSELAIRATKKIVNAAATPHFGDIFLCEPELLERIALSGEPEKRIQTFLKK